MSEVNLSALAEADKNAIEEKAPNPMQEMNVALKECKFGFFQVRLLFTAFIGIVSTVLVTNSSAYLLTNAECDLKMDLVQKGILNATPYLGCLLSSVVAGFLTDTFGRKIFVLYGYLGIFVFTLVSATSQTFEMLIFGRFFEGLFFAIAFSPLVTLTSEFCYNEIRDRVLLCQSSFVALSQVVIALLSWAILVQDWKVTLFDGHIVLNTWNFYLYICSLLPMTASILYIFLPESPRFLLSQKKYDEARETLIKIYVENTGKPAATYPCAYLWRKQSEQIIEEDPVKSGLRHKLVVGLYNVKPMFEKKYGLYLFMVSVMVLLCMLKYNVLRLWYPQLSTILEHSEMGTSNTTQDLCQLLDAYTAELKSHQSMSNGTEVCVRRISGTETYVNSIILGVVCMCPYLISGALVNKVGKKCLLFIGSVAAFGMTIGLRFSTTKGLVVSLFSMDTALTQAMMSLLQASVVEYFPTTSRTLALAFMMTFGRIGTLIGNISFPVLLKIGCIIPFYSMAGVVGVIAVMSIFLPKKKY